MPSQCHDWYYVEFQKYVTHDESQSRLYLWVYNLHSWMDKPEKYYRYYAWSMADMWPLIAIEAAVAATAAT